MRNAERALERGAYPNLEWIELRRPGEADSMLRAMEDRATIVRDGAPAPH